MSATLITFGKNISGNSKQTDFNISFNKKIKKNILSLKSFDDRLIDEI